MVEAGLVLTGFLTAVGGALLLTWKAWSRARGTVTPIVGFSALAVGFAVAGWGMVPAEAQGVGYWLAAAGTAGVLVALGTAVHNSATSKDLVRGQEDLVLGQRELVRISAAQADREGPTPRIVGRPHPFRYSKHEKHLDSTMDGRNQHLLFSVANRGRAPTAVERVSLFHPDSRDTYAWQWDKGELLDFDSVDKWSGQGTKTIPGGTIRDFITRRTFSKEEQGRLVEQDWEAVLRVETLEGQCEWLLGTDPAREPPRHPDEDLVEAWETERQAEGERLRDEYMATQRGRSPTPRPPRAP